MSEKPETKVSTENKTDANPKPKIHRVCISCNNMFEVSIDDYEAKHCPNCRKA